MVADFHACKSNAYSVVPNAAHRIFFLLGLEVSSLDVLPFHINHSIQHLLRLAVRCAAVMGSANQLADF